MILLTWFWISSKVCVPIEALTLIYYGVNSFRLVALALPTRRNMSQCRLCESFGRMLSFRHSETFTMHCVLFLCHPGFMLDGIPLLNGLMVLLHLVWLLWFRSSASKISLKIIRSSITIIAALVDVIEVARPGFSHMRNMDGNVDRMKHFLLDKVGVDWATATAANQVSKLGIDTRGSVPWDEVRTTMTRHGLGLHTCFCSSACA